MAIRTIGVALKSDQPQLGALLRELAKWLQDRGVECLLGPEAAKASGLPGMLRSELADKADLIVVLGGDGTLLAVARAIGGRAVPVLGVNLGTLGYLAEISLDELFPTLEGVLADDLRIETRMRLDVHAERDGSEIGRYLALNDAVIARTALSRMIDLKAWADDVEVTTYHGDGLIAATPTGSSAYSLSAGGPLLLPGIGAIVLTPICPHALTQRPIVLPEVCRVAIKVLDMRGGEVHLTVDGQVGCELQEGDRVSVCASNRPLQMLVPADRNRFEVMRNKLRWGAR
ncbi:MAG: NAD(+)/NADH kinase [Myxococcales bacterium]|nr:NAD(+)/NADH kinase [Myxococcales bacterium]